MSEPLVGTESAAKAIARVKYSHDALIDEIIANPTIPQGELAKRFGYTQTWLSRVMNSDAFLARLAVRKQDLVDPAITVSVDEKLREVASRSLDVVLEKLHQPIVSTDTAMKALEISSKALGYGARQANIAVQTNFVVALPPKAASSADWAAAHGEPAIEGQSTTVTQG